MYSVNPELLSATGIIVFATEDTEFTELILQSIDNAWLILAYERKKTLRSLRLGESIEPRIPLRYIQATKLYTNTARYNYKNLCELCGKRYHLRLLAWGREAAGGLKQVDLLTVRSGDDVRCCAPGKFFYFRDGG